MNKGTPVGTPIYRNAPLSTSPAPPFTLGDATSVPATWDALRKEIRQVEIEIETKLTCLSKFGAKTTGSNVEARGNTNGAGPSAKSSVSALEDGEELEASLDQLMAKLDVLVEAMSAHIDSHQTQNGSPAPMAKVHQLQKHREILQDYTKEYRKTRQSVRSARERSQLLNSVRDDINNFRSGGLSASDHLLNERSRIDQSHQLVDSALEQAFATKEDLDRQRTSLQGIDSRIANVTSQLPSVGQLIGKIQSRKNRDNVILSCVIGSCVVGVLYLVM
ncbi:hypothetical protein BGW38_003246 [Lunasporangiospora selenospora]|uniref:Golgi SNAP receptor complex member 1 n=1 Tax=Lunasporangiospora selenospora TaxID=979761 RepID=A0A9P6FRA6_9FUNG|nr:hypothetical protein BGW38_003246 [Lunasporangiospora selenospora]